MPISKRALRSVESISNDPTLDLTALTHHFTVVGAASNAQPPPISNGLNSAFGRRNLMRCTTKTPRLIADIRATTLDSSKRQTAAIFRMRLRRERSCEVNCSDNDSCHHAWKPNQPELFPRIWHPESVSGRARALVTQLYAKCAENECASPSAFFQPSRS